MKLCVLLRVFDRLDDLAVNLRIIRELWSRHDYHVLVVSNGGAEGHRVPEALRGSIDDLVECPSNAGHIAGNAQLLREGISCVPADCAYTILLEADTWMLSDALVDRYVHQMQTGGAVWASAEWIEKYFSLALDFALVETAFARRHPALFEFTTHAEGHVCEYLRRQDARYLYVREAMPVHIPSSLRRLHDPYGGRNRSFPRAPMVTHHVEDLAGGIAEKLRLADVALGRRVFDVGGVATREATGAKAAEATGTAPSLRLAHLRLRLWDGLTRLAPRSRWISPRRSRETQ